MSITNLDQEYAKLRSYLNPLIRGPVTNSILYALAQNSNYLVNLVDQVQAQLYVSTATGQYLDSLAAAFEIVRDPSIGLGDDEFRQIVIQVSNTKIIRTLINNLLNIIFGDQLTKASSPSPLVEPYALQDQDALIISFDGQAPVTVVFSASQFASIAAATAQEVADSITIYLKSIGISGSAVVVNNGSGNFVQIFSETIGPSSSVQVLGGRSQNVFKFSSPVNAGGNMSTQWTVSLVPGGNLKFLWTGGANPNLGLVSVGNYVNIYGGGFASSPNEGSFLITSVLGGAQGVSYFEISNPLGTPGIITQGSDNAILFFNPRILKVTDQQSYALQFQVQPNVIQIFIPAVTKVVRRTLQGSAHIHDNSIEPNSFPGPYIYDPSQPFTISGISTTLQQNLNGASSKLITVASSTEFPDAAGNLILGFGTSNQEIIPYLATPSSNTILLSPAYTIKNSFTPGTDVCLLASKSAVVIAPDGSDYPFYLTGESSARIYVQDLIQQVAAAGMTVNFTVIYPSDVGLGKYGTPFSEISTIYGQ